MARGSDAQIRALTDRFVADLTEVIQEAALEAVQNALGSVSGPTKRKGRARRRAARKASPGGRRKKVSRRKGVARASKRLRRSSEAVGATATNVVAHVRKNPGASVGEIGKALRLTTKELRLPIQKLIADKKLRTKGEKRATRYFAAKR